MTSGIYIIRNIVTDMFYIGSSVNIRVRWNDHKSTLNRNKHGNTHLQRAWNKYGADSFTFEIVELCNRDVITEREQHWLDTYLPMGNCYNIAKNAQHSSLGLQRSPEHKQRLSEALKGKKHAPMSPEGRKHISEAVKGRKHTPEARQRMSEAMMGKNRGKKRTPDQIRVMSEVRKGKPLSAERRQKLIEANTGREYSLETREKIKAANAVRFSKPEAHQQMSEVHLRRSKWYEFTHPNGETTIAQGLAPFCREHGLTLSNLHIVANGKRSQHKGFKCRVLTDEEVHAYLDSNNQRSQNDKDN